MSATPNRSIWWEGDVVEVIDQRVLPHRFELATWSTVDDVAAGIADMTVRGAPLIGVSAAYGMVLAVAADPSDSALAAAADLLVASRPTAVNLPWAVGRMMSGLAPVEAEDRLDRARILAADIADGEVAACRRIGELGAELLAEVHRRTASTVNVMTHCNAGWLACVEWGTATAPVYVAREQGIPVHVWVSETRPRNQGASLTAWELGRAGVDHTVIVDNAAGHVLAEGLADVVIVGADRVARNGDTANKIGTSLKAYAARRHGVPFHVAVPWSTIDGACADGRAIPIEERSADEVASFAGSPIAPPGSPVRNWGFDVTPADCVTSWITERGVLVSVADALAGAAEP